MDYGRKLTTENQKHNLEEKKESDIGWNINENKVIPFPLFGKVVRTLGQTQ